MKVHDKNKALEGLEQLSAEIGRNILQAPVHTILNDYEASLSEFSKAAPKLYYQIEQYH